MYLAAVSTSKRRPPPDNAKTHLPAIDYTLQEILWEHDDLRAILGRLHDPLCRLGEIFLKRGEDEWRSGFGQRDCRRSIDWRSLRESYTD
jgi:hypothetical protein